MAEMNTIFLDDFSVFAVGTKCRYNHLTVVTNLYMFYFWNNYLT